MKRICIGVCVQSTSQRIDETLASLRLNTTPDVEVVLLFDGPGEVARSAPLPHAQGLRRLVTVGTGGGAACFNLLASHSDADILILLEAGARVSRGWLEHLTRGLDANPHNGLAGPSTNNAWNEQCVFRGAGDSREQIARSAETAKKRFGDQLRTLEPLYSLADFCYVVRREVIESIGAADENYSLGPCWEMDYNIRAARAGWHGVWVCAAYVHRAPYTARRRFDEARRFEASKHLYQDKFCGARLRREKKDYREHCRGDACANFAPTALIEIKRPFPAKSLQPSPSWTEAAVTNTMTPATNQPATVSSSAAPLVTCIMPTHNRRQFIPQAIRCFLRQDYTNLELLVVDDGTDPIADCIPESEHIRYIRLDHKLTLGTKRNFACEQARGEFIVHWDDDDWYPNNRVSRQVQALLESNCEISGSSRILYYDVSTAQTWEYRYSCAGWVGGNTLAYRKIFWSQHRFPNVQVGEDSRFVWRSPGRSIYDLGDPTLCVATAHSGNTSRKDFYGSYWFPRSRESISSLLGDDIYFYYRVSCEWPLVSCIMPTYNRRLYVQQALQLFLQQDYPNRELIIVDDGSDRIEDLIPAAMGITYFRPPRRMTIGAKRNAACQRARGEIIAHWDDDDWYSPDRLRYQVSPIVAGLADLTGLENAFVLQLPAGEFWTTDSRLHQRMFVENVHGGTLAYRKSIWSAGVRYPEVNLAEDASLLYRAKLNGNRLLRLSNPGVFVYVRHGRNAWREFSPGSFIDPKGWQRIPRPLNFPEKTFSSFMGLALRG